ncbi:uncharacterized protein LOC18438593 [Amborella trichopoda]|uniref:Uncharacterized protein n=1 Tax=Amborella trichopoda TaxID=13333 RepID=W1PT10_AMBTC|nr:uncharacterized protein LOC18438593 [Amborella trichopoda]ERN10420.1 hypothetical protein AMTR_s00026p00191410 [Amborella trichopoda]|eukprot:XP_006848839.1 uncharacterized protein LOC18438593 [Amborella trichopoda]
MADDPKSQHPRCASIFSCCFGSGDSPDSGTPTLLHKLKVRAQELPEFKGRCRSMIAKIGREGLCGPKATGDFRYDPLSYAMNFDSGEHDDGDEDSPNRADFSSRFVVLPPSRGRMDESRALTWEISAIS